MSNNYFQFKQFTIQQDKCAMKVCTDACLFGAFVADEIQGRTIKHILDIGTGTGLLSLILAQKINVEIDAVEIDNIAHVQAKENIAQSPWKEKIIIHHSGIADFFRHYQYDVIISNPPFFEDDLKSGDIKKNAVKHDATLTLQKLLNNIDRLLSEDGSFAVLLPIHRVDYFISESLKMNFYLTNKVLVKQTIAHHFFRGMLIFSKTKSAAIQTNELSIKNEAGNYTTEFINLLKDYYLYL